MHTHGIENNLKTHQPHWTYLLEVQDCAWASQRGSKSKRTRQEKVYKHVRHGQIPQNRCNKSNLPDRSPK